MRETILADTGPLVALLDQGDAWHERAVREFRQLRPPLLTCEVVLGECCHLLAGLPASRLALARLQQESVLEVWDGFSAQAPAVWRLMERYADVPMDFADACLVRLTEVLPEVRVWTYDSDFQIYRRNGRQAIPLV